MEAALATIDEARNEIKSLGAALPTTCVAFSHDVPAAETVHISVEEFRLLAVMRDGMTLNDLIATNAASTVDSMRIVRQLLERGLLIAGPRKQTR
ncbi:hypothetical protein [Candidatus Cryosericum septentrionale]|jgi:uncharacterized protein YerC|uniref:Uncharacterized protein n=1 Tax=Candidatus Cryosericum septentrionale TaxID=2290913 RepID=A0A398DZZ7_9BACT|nr:hypothetical protein [Candidatus Cryosericum septentrionale]RIE15961.1 hypothetical protein SMC1_09125 [Candidatus Cryosericum septentrionale]